MQLPDSHKICVSVISSALIETRVVCTGWAGMTDHLKNFFLSGCLLSVCHYACFE